MTSLQQQPGVVVSQSPSTRPIMKLQQSYSGRQIGETMVVQYFPTTTNEFQQLVQHLQVLFTSINVNQFQEAAFELANRRGYYLRVRDTGLVEFNVANYPMDDFFRFCLIPVGNGNYFLMPKAFTQSINIKGGRGWYLTILSNGNLSGNGAREITSEWTFQRLSPTNLTLTGSATASGETIPPQQNPPLPTSPAIREEIPSFPGLAAGREELMKYFATPYGLEFLSQQEYKPALELYQRDRVLARLLHRPDWPLQAAKFHDYYHEPLPVLDASLVDQYAPMPLIKQFFHMGWMEVAKIVSNQEYINNAKKIMNYWQFKYMHEKVSAHNTLKRSRGYTVECIGDVAWDYDLLTLYYQSPLPHIMQQLMGENEVAHPKLCRPMLVYPTFDLTEQPALCGDKWVIDGFTSEGGHSPYNMLIGIALSDCTDIDQGNFAVHSESHLTLLKDYKTQADTCQTNFSDNPYKVQKQDLGLPTQFKMKAGDCFICTQRLAHLFAINTRADPTMFVFFEVSHVDHPVLKTQALSSIWLEYKNAGRYLEDQNAGILLPQQDALSSKSARPGNATGHVEDEQVNMTTTTTTTNVPIGTPIASAVPGAPLPLSAKEGAPSSSSIARPTVAIPPAQTSSSSMPNAQASVNASGSAPTGTGPQNRS